MIRRTSGSRKALKTMIDREIPGLLTSFLHANIIRKVDDYQTCIDYSLLPSKGYPTAGVCHCPMLSQLGICLSKMKLSLQGLEPKSVSIKNILRQFPPLILAIYRIVKFVTDAKKFAKQNRAFSRPCLEKSAWPVRDLPDRDFGPLVYSTLHTKARTLPD